ncbi:RsiV family protein [Aggregatibacter segnis]|uniref:RsiV family protein n=1 Tax=Aggregatibacter segnis TaxID=739 RepID=UPI0028E95000|nr:RsiV family protein [Aggregatibacter segnis]
MKKLLVSALAVAGLTLTGCNDEEKNTLSEQVKKQTQTIEQLNAQVNTLQRQVLDLAENQAIRVEPEVLFEKSETIKFDNKSPNSLAPEEAEVKISVKSLKANMDWLTDLLVNELIRQFTAEGKVKIENKQQFIEYLQTHYADNVKEVKEFELIGISTNVDVEYLGQRENIATFTMGYHHYSGGAHGMYSTQFVNVDLDKKAVIQLDDVFTKAQQNKVKALLWEIYQNESRGDNGERQEPFTAKADFYLSDNFYFSQDGIVFVYPPYALGPYAAGEKELRLSLYDDEVKALLTPAFKFLGKNYVE